MRGEESVQVDGKGGHAVCEETESGAIVGIIVQIGRDRFHERSGWGQGVRERVGGQVLGRGERGGT